MSPDPLRNCRVLVVEDDYLLADDLAHALGDAGAIVVGPVRRIDEAIGLIGCSPPIDLALLDVNLGGDMVFPVADALLERRIPFAFVTGYDDWALPSRFAEISRIEKPLRHERLAATIAPLLSG